MEKEIKIPQLGESVTEVTIANLLKENGAFVKLDEELVEVETEKVNQVLNSPATGYLKLKVKVGDRVAIGEIIGVIVVAEEKKEEGSPKELPKEEKKEKAPPKEEEKEKAPPKDEKQIKEPFQEPTEKKSETKFTRKRMSALRKTIANRLLEAQKNAAILTTFNEIDMTHVMELRSKHKEEFEKKHGVRLGLMSFFTKAVVEALKAVPGLNSFIEGDDIVERHDYDIGIAVGTERGLIVPVIRKCDILSFAQIEKEILNYAEKAKKGGLVPEDLEGGSFTITNGGVYGSLLSTPMLNPPQSGILGMHKIEKRAVVINDTIVIRQMMYVALSYDHRVVDGKEAVTFLVHIKEHLEDPTRFLIDI